MFNDIADPIAVPVFLDDNPEMLVGMMMINPEYAADFDACPPMRTHTKQCPKHGKHVDHYSLPGTDKKPAFNIEIKVTPL